MLFPGCSRAPRLLDGRRPALRHGPGDRLRGRALAAVRRRQPGPADLGPPLSRRLRRSGRGMYIAHVFIFPALIGGLWPRTWRSWPPATTRSSAARPRATERDWSAFRIPRPGAALARTESPTAARSALGGLVQINPIWLWGPYQTWLGTNGAQPDWYLGWLSARSGSCPASTSRSAQNGHPEPVLGRRRCSRSRDRRCSRCGRGWSAASRTTIRPTTCSTARATPPADRVRTGFLRGWCLSSSPARRTASRVPRHQLRHADLVLARRGLGRAVHVGRRRLALCLALKGKEAVEADQQAAVRSAQPE